MSPVTFRISKARTSQNHDAIRKAIKQILLTWLTRDLHNYLIK